MRFFPFVSLFVIVILTIPAAMAAGENPAADSATGSAILHGITRGPATSEITKVPVSPEPSKTRSGSGRVTVISTPAGASVSVDGTIRGLTPAAGIELPADRDMTIRISLAGYEPYTTVVKVGAGETAAVDATLRALPGPEPTVTPAPVPTVPSAPVGAGRGWIRVNCNTDGAEVSFDQHPASCTIAQGSCSTEVGTAVAPYRTFTVKKPGYEDYSGPVTAWPGEGRTVDLYATLNPLPAYGAIEVLTDPSGTVVTLDGTTQRYSPASFSSVTAGTSHTIQITASGFQPYTATVWVERQKTATIHAQLIPLVPAPETGSVSVTSAPSGADIYVDGQYTAYTPAVIPGLAPGTHTIRLQKAGYDEFVTALRITPGQRIPLSVPLGTLPPTVGSMEISSVPPGASVFVDGTYMGLTQQNDYFDVTSLLQGTHTVILRLADYQDYTHTAFVSGGNTVTVNAVMTPVAPGPVPDTTGQIAVTSVPPGANVFLDNTFRGITPVTLNDIPQGPHLLSLQQAGYTNAARTVTVNGGGVATVEMDLMEAVPAPTRRSPGWAVTGIAALVIAIAGLRIAVRKG